MDQFFTLTPERILDAIESCYSIRATGRVMALNSLENRVYDLEIEEQSNIVCKFYRPERWSREQIQEEHNFLFKLLDAEIPVVTPIAVGGESLFSTDDGILFAAFPKVKGRLRDELSESQLRSVGRYLARMHSVGAVSPFRHRLTLTPKIWGKDSLRQLVDGQWIDLTFERRYCDQVNSILNKITPLFEGIKPIALHGDCHLGNILWQDEAPFFVDFDDAVMGPPVQDVWMVVRGRDDDADAARDILLSGYEEMRSFDRRELKMIEALRAMRMIHYSAWIAKRWKDPMFKHHFPNFMTAGYWEEELQALREVEATL